MLLKMFFGNFFVLSVAGWYSWVNDKLWPPCKVDVPGSMYELRQNIQSNLFGQHLVASYVERAIESHLSKHSPQHALSMVFIGSTGTGKNYVARMIENAIHPNDKKTYVRFYSGRLHFTSPDKIHEYQERLKEDVKESVKSCAYSIFIFDEIDKIPPGIIDVIKPYLDYHPVVNNVDYRKAIFIFLSNWGKKEINGLYLELRNSGLARESMQYKHFEKTLRSLLHTKSGGMFQGSSLITDYSLGFFLPFLPLEKIHVTQCIMHEMSRRGMKVVEENIQDVLSNLEFFESLSVSGCKRIADMVGIAQYRHSEL